MCTRSSNPRSVVSPRSENGNFFPATICRTASEARISPPFPCPVIRAAVRLQRIAHHALMLPEQLPRFGVAEAVGERRRAFHVREQDGVDVVNSLRYASGCGLLAFAQELVAGAQRRV